MLKQQTGQRQSCCRRRPGGQKTWAQEQQRAQRERRRRRWKGEMDEVGGGEEGDTRDARGQRLAPIGSSGTARPNINPI